MANDSSVLANTHTRLEGVNETEGREVRKKTVEECGEEAGEVAHPDA